MSDHPEPTDDFKLLTGQAQGQLNLALQWLDKKNPEAASAFVVTVKKLLTLSSATDSEAWINYYYVRAAVAESRGHLKAALGYCRKSLAAARRVHPENHHAVLIAKANVGESLAKVEKETK